MVNIYYVIAFLSVLIASFSQILLKKGAMRNYSSFLREYLNGYVIMGYLMMFFSVLLTMIVYRGIDFMNVPVIEAIGYVIVPLLAYIFFREKITRYKVAGILFILAGIFVYYV